MTDDLSLAKFIKDSLELQVIYTTHLSIQSLHKVIKYTGNNIRNSSVLIALFSGIKKFLNLTLKLAENSGSLCYAKMYRF